ncbi:segregation and condensation protein B [Mycoplasmopsis canis UFG4]|uniref:Segregation and condensation protein B n=2 Tax=Mycoplasmopsis canis TaxID=29555 RepID=I1A7D5_9BACT|nr:SMC-Scp complex subunit ScpB [Mycoplasmopsis canis]AKF40886.1 segregation protein A [Mycoplasmopsis canis]AMD81006.1 segregation/condensation protein B [Mycoplasmopsis canis PG 14]EIE40981.1 segregation and condensation protein B [Mycoplasmopsis canis PG 14]EIE41058.1 segregation and condensation protein B [Mycoplasmopsis canis UF31]EIE41182.1 segregation and condensation protein B [Mycoplasmopsis canis UF33]
MKNKILEALLYVQGDEGLTLEQVKQVFNLNNTSEAKKVMQDFHKSFNEEDRGIKVVVYDEIYKLATRETVREYVSKLVTIVRPNRLSNAAIEVAGIIAYKQPITRSQITKIRGGAASDQVINTLLVKGVIEEVGISPTPGRPVLYGVTSKFYDHFRISSLRDLPKMDDFNYVDGLENEHSDFDLFSSQREDN